MALCTAATKVDELLAVLDEDIRHLEAHLSHLEELRGLLIKRDDAALGRLLIDIRQQGDAHAVNERRRHEIRTELAGLLGCNDAQVTLSTLQASLADPRRQAVIDRQAKLKSLVQRMKREHTLTSLLVSDCARFNRSLMGAFFGLGHSGGMTYGPSGAARAQTDASLVSLQF